jgi:hypothetical protein
MVRTRFIGSGREREGGYSATHNQNFVAHYNGGDFRHDATQIDLNPVLPEFTSTTLQGTLEELAFSGLNGGFITIGDGYNTLPKEDLYYAFQWAFARIRINGIGGIIVIKPGDYILRKTVEVPKGITIWGEPGGARIVSEVINGPAFKFLYSEDIENLGIHGLETIISTKMSRLWNITIFDNKDGNVNSGAPSWTNGQLIQMDEGCELLLENVTIIGRVYGGITTRYGIRVVTPVSPAPVSTPTILHLNKCYIDGVSTAIRFAPTNEPHLSELRVENCRVRTITTTNTGYFISTCIGKIFIHNNYYFAYTLTGYTKYGYFLNLIAQAVPVENAFVSLIGNKGSIFITDNPDSNELMSRTNYILDSRVVKWAFILSDVGNFWGSVKSNPWYITIGDGIHSTGDFTGTDSLELVNSLINTTALGISSIDENYLSSRGEQIIIVNPGTYTVNTQLKVGKIIGNISTSSTYGTSRKVIIQLNSDIQNLTSGVYTNYIGKAENIEFVAINHPQQIISNLQDVQDYNIFKNVSFINCTVGIENTKSAIVENCRFEQTGVFSDIVNLDILSSSCYVLNCYFNGYGYGFRVNNVNAYVSLENCIFNLTASGIRTKSAITNQKSYIFINAYNVFIDNININSPQVLVSASLLNSVNYYKYHTNITGTNSLVINNSNISGPDQKGLYVTGDFLHSIICCYLSSEKLIELNNNKIIGGIPVYIYDFSVSSGSGIIGGKINIHGNEIRHHDIPTNGISNVLCIKTSTAGYSNHTMCVGSVLSDEEGQISSSSINISDNKFIGVLTGTNVRPIDVRSEYGTLIGCLVNIMAPGWNVNFNSNDVNYSCHDYTLVYPNGTAMTVNIISALGINTYYAGIYSIVKVINNTIEHRNTGILTQYHCATSIVTSGIANINSNMILSWYCNVGTLANNFIQLNATMNGSLICGNSFNSNYKVSMTEPIFVVGGHGIVSSNWFDIDDETIILDGSGASDWILTSENYGNYDF